MVGQPTSIAKPWIADRIALSSEAGVACSPSIVTRPARPEGISCIPHLSIRPIRERHNVVWGEVVGERRVYGIADRGVVQDSVPVDIQRSLRKTRIVGVLRLVDPGQRRIDRKRKQGSADLVSEHLRNRPRVVIAQCRPHRDARCHAPSLGARDERRGNDHQQNQDPHHQHDRVTAPWNQNLRLGEACVASHSYGSCVHGRCSDSPTQLDSEDLSQTESHGRPPTSYPNRARPS